MNKHLKLWISSIIVCCFTQTSLAINKEWKKGYVITSDNDTLHGQIAIISDYAITAKTCIFRASVSNEETIYGPQDLTDFVIDNKLYFTSLNINSTYIKGRYFVQRLVQGATSLYYINLPEDSISHYVISKPNIESMATIPSINSLGPNDIKVRKMRKALNVIFADCPAIKEDIDKQKLTKDELIQITKKYNDLTCGNDKCVIYSEKKVKRHSYITPFVEAKLSPMKYVEKQTVYSPVIGVDYALSLLHYSERLRFHCALGISETNYSGENYKLRMIGIDNHLLLEYRFMDKKVKPMFGFGVAQYVNLPITNWETDQIGAYTYTDKMDYEKYHLFLEINGGIDISVNHKHSIPIRLSYQRMLSTIATSPSAERITLNAFSLSIGYTFQL